MVPPSPSVDTASQPAASLVIATANVLTLYPQEEDQGETWAPSALRAALAKQIREVGVDILGVQEGPRHVDFSRNTGGSGGTELWINTSSCDRAVVSIRDPSRLVVTCMVGGHTLDFCVLLHPRRTLLNGRRNGGHGVQADSRQSSHDR